MKEKKGGKKEKKRENGKEKIHPTITERNENL